MNDYAAAGYFLTRPAPAPGYEPGGLLPATVRTLSSCLASIGFEYWWNSENAAEAVEFGVPPERIDSLVEWYLPRFDDALGAPNVAFGTSVISDFVDAFVPNPEGLIILGCALAEPDADNILVNHAAPEGHGEYGIYQLLKRGQSIEPGGTTLGFEPLCYEYGLEHSWLCNQLQGEAHTRLGITPDPQTGLLDTYEEAKAITDWISRGEVGAEPGLWLPWMIVEYSV